nr:PREDICTED: uncharacterized protein LOC109040347 [Bemisia tabaci]
MSCCRTERSRTAGTLLGQSKDQEIFYYVLEEDRLKDALAVLVEGFYPDEPATSLYYRVSEDEEAIQELNLLMAETAKDEISVIAVSAQTDRVVGVLFNKIQEKTKPGELPFFEKFKRGCKNARSIGLIDYMAEIDDKVDVLGAFNVDRMVELVFLGVSPAYRKRGIAQDLFTLSLEYVKSKRVAEVACTLGTSVFTQRIAKKHNFKNMVEVPYERDHTDDHVFDRVVSIHQKAILFAKQL